MFSHHGSSQRWARLDFGSRRSQTLSPQSSAADCVWLQRHVDSTAIPRSVKLDSLVVSSAWPSELAQLRPCCCGLTLRSTGRAGIRFRSCPHRRGPPVSLIVRPHQSAVRAAWASDGYRRFVVRCGARHRTQVTGCPRLAVLPQARRHVLPTSQSQLPPRRRLRRARSAVGGFGPSGRCRIASVLSSGAPTASCAPWCWRLWSGVVAIASILAQRYRVASCAPVHAFGNSLWRGLTLRSTGRAGIRLRSGWHRRGPPVSLYVRPHQFAVRAAWAKVGAIMNSSIRQWLVARGWTRRRSLFVLVLLIPIWFPLVQALLSLGQRRLTDSDSLRDLAFQHGYVLLYGVPLLIAVGVFFFSHMSFALRFYAALLYAIVGTAVAGFSVMLFETIFLN